MPLSLHPTSGREKSLSSLPSRIGHTAVRSLHMSAALHATVVDFLLSDPGEGIAEVEIIKWNIAVGPAPALFAISLFFLPF